MDSQDFAMSGDEIPDIPVDYRSMLTMGISARVHLDPPDVTDVESQANETPPS